ncbi:MAG: enoyl-CoA hydratase [Pyrinomonadaceae bacterium]
MEAEPTNDLIKIATECGVATITLNRPEKLNAFYGRMRRDLAEALEDAGADSAIRVVVVTGAGRAFCAGGDVAYMAELAERRDDDEFSRLLGAARRVIMAIRQMPKPVLAAVNGPAHGAGFNLALACDMRIASADATFAQSFAKIGFHPDWGGTYLLPHLVPQNIACEMFFLGDTINAERAYQLGLVNRVVAADEFETEARKLAERLRNAPPISVGAAKLSTYQAENESIERMLQIETENQLRCFQSQDAREGLRAFAEKRAPKFTGR